MKTMSLGKTAMVLNKKMHNIKNSTINKNRHCQFVSNDVIRKKNSSWDTKHDFISEYSFTLVTVSKI